MAIPALQMAASLMLLLLLQLGTPASLQLGTPASLQLPAAAATATAATDRSVVGACLPNVTCAFHPGVNQTVRALFRCLDIEATMRSAISHIQSFLKFTDAHLQNKYRDVHAMVVPNFPGTTRGQTIGNRIELSGDALLTQYHLGRGATFLNYLVYHEMTHVWQPIALSYVGAAGVAFIEGTASFMSYSAGYKIHNECGPPRDNPIDVTEWHRGYCTTAEFLGFLSKKNSCFVADLNRAMESSPYNDTVFRNLVRMYPDDAWMEYVREYKAGNYKPESPMLNPCPRRPNPTSTGDTADDDGVGVITTTTTGGPAPRTIVLED